MRDRRAPDRPLAGRQRPLPRVPRRDRPGRAGDGRGRGAGEPSRHRSLARRRRGVLPLGWAAGGRLPTGDEWEAAARGTTAGHTRGATPSTRALQRAETGWGGTTPVDANPGGAWCGAEDLAGNVWEWVADRDADGWRRVRGGCHLDTGWGLRATRVQPPTRTAPRPRPDSASHQDGRRDMTPTRSAHGRAGGGVRPLLRGPRHQHRGHGGRRGRRDDGGHVGSTSSSPPAGARSSPRCRPQSPTALKAIDGVESVEVQGRLGSRLDHGPAGAVGA